MSRNQYICATDNSLSEQEAFRPLISRINQFVRSRGIDLYECYKDFDQLNSGRVGESQVRCGFNKIFKFYRSFPGPPDINDAEICALAKRYSVPNHPGMVNYRQFASDVAEINIGEEIAKHGIPNREEISDVQQPEKKDLQTPSVHQVLERIGFEAYRRGVRVKDFFIDFDPLRHDEVTENQFKLALDRALGGEIQPTDAQKLVNFFRSKKNMDMIAYRQFCREVDFHFQEMDLEKRPLVQPRRPYPGALSRPLPLLGEEERMKVSGVITRLREKVSRERIPTYQYFRDYDASTSLSRKITPSQLARLLHFLKLEVSPEECRLLSLKFADPTANYVNYAALCEAIDPFYKAAAPVPQAIEDPPPLPPKPKFGEAPKTPQGTDWSALSTPMTTSAGDKVPVDLLMTRIRHIVLVNRIQLNGFFEDFDPLHSGRVSRSQFARALSGAGVTRIGLHDLTPVQLDKLADAYVWPNDASRVDWRKFVYDVNTVFTLPEIEQNPRCRVLPLSVHVVPKPGTGNWDSATDEMKDRYECAMQNLRRSLLERRVDMKPEFKAFAKVNRGHVSLYNLKQIISSLKFHIPDDQLDAVAAKYADDEGFNYWRFLTDLEPPSKESLHYEYPHRIARMREAFNKTGKPVEAEPVISDVEGIMDYIKREVYQQRIRLSEWFRDYDPLRRGHISRQRFRRALSLLPIPLKETELSCIESYFKTNDANEIRWKDFCEEIERIFATPYLEKDPLKEAEVYTLEPEVSRNCLPIEMSEAADQAMRKISKMVRTKRTQLTQWFSDFDKTHRMTLSESQFQRVLTNLGVATGISKEEWNALSARYRHPIGRIDDINYLAFSDDIYKLAGMEHRTP
ncbi:hypothetical protein EGR_03555 [Echinococcus granulosus]|uniref:Uncharacterized protein n=2 Tax=Echinococcus granulosus TaxID=6210 RepID=W6UK26_ECHGR|nr:hypothetical protein EGR_03555 [Echinococcus granulosus]EUB61491.1 hypothetical protein EGR_03555 [Echinococcus granulosus]